MNAERFWAKVAPGRCPQEWQGYRNLQGYGQISVDGQTRIAHRVRWELDNGPIPGGLWVLHRCDNPPCVTLTHLFLGTPTDNQLDSVAKGRHKETRKTHCPQGHPYDEANTYQYGNNRQCRVCNLVYVRRYQEARS